MEFKVPELGENVSSGDVVKVLVRVGQAIEANQGVVELETDKAVIELPCPHAGTVSKIHVKKGDTVKVGQPLLTLTAGEGAEAAEESPAAEPPASKPPANRREAAAALRDAENETPPKTPIGSDADEGSEQAAPPEPARGGKRAAKAPAAAREKADAALAKTAARAAQAPTPPAPPMPPDDRTESGGGVSPATGTAPARPAAQRGGPIPAGPAARRLARESGVDLGSVSGSGTRGRITLDDVRSAQSAADEPAAEAEAPRGGSLAAIPEAQLPAGEGGEDAFGPIIRQKMPAIRRAIAAQMVKSATTIPHVTNFDDADITDLERIRKGVPANHFGANIKLTTTPFVIKAVADGLRRHPMLNASLDEEAGQIVYKQYVHIGIAVDTPRGLIVPVMRNVDHMSIAEVARSLASIAERARQAQFTLEDLKGGTFTLSNLGAVGGSYSTPVINHPEVAILLVGRSRWLPVVREDKIEPRLMMPLSLSYDHRLVDGGTAARFLNDVIDSLQNPGKLLLS